MSESVTVIATKEQNNFFFFQFIAILLKYSHGVLCVYGIEFVNETFVYVF